jgi:RHS repeat-associated protein
VVVARFDYAAFGEVSQQVGSAAADELHRFTGKPMDGTGLYYFNARYMDPEIGRFISRDPAMDGANWWAYASNNPLNRIDPTGLVDRDGNGKEDEEEQYYHNDSTACCEGRESGCKDYGDGYDNNKSGGSSQQVFVEGGSQAPTVPLGSGVAPQGASNLAPSLHSRVTW